ncbi:hypothetical protein CLV59_103634 [Chitinophaga dinghuensis]|uniref:Uncharacterized protein n=1 Tax=Chitinophaga dinghuensis TaxID=1539050 RepID=A0A327W4R5_9BACT|nr:hypothetical protein [Chitinophaga dinghuensis]RAJ83663.1 hypothetical protein CLV59_103634 [Chitinophaga dinghuensis]
MMENKDNLLRELHDLYNQSAVGFRDRLCADFDWSIPTYYRKMRLIEKEDVSGTRLSNVEKEKISQVALSMQKEFQEKIFNLIKHC